MLSCCFFSQSACSTESRAMGCESLDIQALSILFTKVDYYIVATDIFNRKSQKSVAKDFPNSKFRLLARLHNLGLPTARLSRLLQTHISAQLCYLGLNPDAVRF